LGVKIDLEPEQSQKMLHDINICFLFAQKYHKAMRFVGPVRKEMGIRTLFNCLGPLANPAGVSMQLLGVYSQELVEPLAHVLHNLGVKKAMVVYGKDSIDEISLSAPTYVCEFQGDDFKTYEMTPEQFGLKTCRKEELAGGTPEENAKIVHEILEGTKGPKQDAVLFNAGAALHISMEDTSIEDGIKIARKVIEEGKAKAKLEEFIQASQK
jgi:anthranilate phosphoribosyltransferase